MHASERYSLSHDPGDELIALGLGSCIALVMIDSQAQIAGLAHVMLPESSGPTTLPGKFADTAVPELLDRMIGAGRDPRAAACGDRRRRPMFAGESSWRSAPATPPPPGWRWRRAGLPCHAQETGGTRVVPCWSTSAPAADVPRPVATSSISAARTSARIGSLMECSNRIASRRSSRPPGRATARAVVAPPPRAGAGACAPSTSAPDEVQRRSSARARPATETFCQMAATRLTTELRCPVELEPLGTSQLTWSATRADLAALAAHRARGRPARQPRLLTLEQSLVIMCLECMLGGAPDQPAAQPPADRDRLVARHSLFDSLVTPLSTRLEGARRRDAARDRARRP